jgi:hypothetical protein
VPGVGLGRRMAKSGTNSQQLELPKVLYYRPQAGAHPADASRTRRGSGVAVRNRDCAGVNQRAGALRGAGRTASALSGVRSESEGKE